MMIDDQGNDVKEKEFESDKIMTVKNDGKAIGALPEKEMQLIKTRVRVMIDDDDVNR